MRRLLVLFTVAALGLLGCAFRLDAAPADAQARTALALAAAARARLTAPCGLAGCPCGCAAGLPCTCGSTYAAAFKRGIDENKPLVLWCGFSSVPPPFNGSSAIYYRCAVSCEDCGCDCPTGKCVLVTKPDGKGDMILVARLPATASEADILAAIASRQVAPIYNPHAVQYPAAVQASLQRLDGILAGVGQPTYYASPQQFMGGGFRGGFGGGGGRSCGGGG